MPEYAALLHHHKMTSEEGDQTPPSEEDVTSMFLKMERAGVGKVH